MGIRSYTVMNNFGPIDMQVNFALKQVVFAFKGQILKPIDTFDEVTEIKVLMTCGRVTEQIV